MLMMIPPGMWSPALGNILREADALWVQKYAVAVGPFVAVFSSLIFSSLADRKMEAQKLLGILALSGAVFLWLAFSSLKWGWSPWWFVFFQGMNALISAPMFALIMKIILSNITNKERQYPLYYAGGTIGWAFAGILTSLLSLDTSPDAGVVGAYIRVCMGAMCFMLPSTPPAKDASRGWKAALGLEALTLFKQRPLRVYFITTALIAIPYVSFYMHGPMMLKDLGSLRPTGDMTYGQAAELVSIAILGLMGHKFKMRWLVIFSLSLGVLRFVLFMVGAQTGVLGWALVGCALHGPIYAFMSITGRVFVDRRVPEKLRGQAQALMGLLSGSIGGVAGSYVCAGVYDMNVAGAGNAGWYSYWGWMAAMVAVCLVYFIVGYGRVEPALPGEGNEPAK